ncbi:hypothetical protein IWX90DRAFT_226677 [Phyllosticta citrichinensis]|uniref:Uncharacterized protein n=1 Tax=Phyllosticta citrichinensis TaxID=1130410 RepID=A0ABR1XUL3_9PEZI
MLFISLHLSSTSSSSSSSIPLSLPASLSSLPLLRQACERTCIQTINLCSFTLITFSFSATHLPPVNHNHDDLTPPSSIHPCIHQFSHPKQSAPAPPKPKTSKSINEKIKRTRELVTDKEKMAVLCACMRASFVCGGSQRPEAGRSAAHGA